MKRHLLKRMIIISVLIVGLLCMAIPSAALAAGPTLKVSPSSGSVPDVVRVYGKYWDSGAVDIYVDPQQIPDPHHLVCKTWTRYGAFDSTIHLPAMSVGPHEIVAVQGGTQKTVIYTVKCAPALDDRIKDEIKEIFHKVLDIETIVIDIQDRVKVILTKVTDIQTVVNEIKQGILNKVWPKLLTIEGKVDDIETKLDNPTYGLEEIKTEVSNIETTVTNIESDLDLKITYREFSGSAQSNAGSSGDIHDAHKVNLRSVSGEPMCIVHVAVHSNPWFFNQLYNTCWVRAWVDTGSGEFLARSVDLAKESSFEFPSPGKYRIEVIRLLDTEGTQNMKWYIIEEIREGDLP